MQKPSGDKGFQRERDICLHFAHCPQLSNRFVFVFARVRPPRTRRRGAPSNLGHCHPRHILEAEAARAAESRRAAPGGPPWPGPGNPGATGATGRRGGRSCTRGGRWGRGLGSADAEAGPGFQPLQPPGQTPSRSSVGSGGGKGGPPLHPPPPIFPPKKSRGEGREARCLGEALSQEKFCSPAGESLGT